MLGKTNVSIVPKAIVIKSGCALQRVPLAVMSVTAEISDLKEEPAHRDERIIQSVCQIGQDPAWTPVEEFFELFGGAEL